MFTFNTIKTCVRVILNSDAYSMYSSYRAQVMTKFRPIVISGPSGSGKSTLLTKLFKEFEGVFAFSVSHTTRKPRDGEQEGREYYFVDRPTFEKMIAEKKFLEHAEFAGNRYGTSKMAVEKVQSMGKICMLDVEVKGVQNIKETDLNARFIFVQPPNMEALKAHRTYRRVHEGMDDGVWWPYMVEETGELGENHRPWMGDHYPKQRLQGRGTESEESLQRRLDTAKEAMDYAQKPGSYDHIIINDDLEKTYQELRKVLIDEYIHHFTKNGSWCLDIRKLQSEKEKET